LNYFHPLITTDLLSSADMALLDRFKKGLSKSRETFTSGLTSAFKRHPKIDELFWENLEEVLISGDVGFEATMEIVDNLRAAAKKERLKESEDLWSHLTKKIAEMLKIGEPSILKAEKQVVLVIGVNGSGKTTTIAKLAHKLKDADKSCLLAGADTFRAAAIEQLEKWAERVQVRMIKHERGSDPAAVVFDSINAAKAGEIDYVLGDTAGRLHTQKNLMEELKKIKRVAERQAGDYSVKTLLVLDANTGQNALAQTKLFNDELGVDEIALTKMDGTAKGGIIIAIAKNFNIPVSFIGIGEKIDDLQEFNPELFAKALVEV